MLHQRSTLIWVAASIVLALIAVSACLLALTFTYWYNRSALAGVGPLETPTSLPLPPTIAPGAAQPPESGARPLSSAPNLPGLPADVPLPEGVDPQSFVGSGSDYSFLTSISYQQAREFYLTELPARGWEKIDYGTRLGDESTELRYRKENRTLTVRIVNMPFIGRLIEVNLRV